MKNREVLTEYTKARKRNEREIERMLARYDFECGEVITYTVQPTKKRQEALPYA